jgi:hypothetical protein
MFSLRTRDKREEKPTSSTFAPAAAFSLAFFNGLSHLLKLARQTLDVRATEYFGIGRGDKNYT